MTGICANCGHDKHDDDPGTGDFCFRVTQDGLCGCESFTEADGLRSSKVVGRVP